MGRQVCLTMPCVCLNITLMRIIYEPGEIDPREVGAFARIYSEVGTNCI